MSQKEKKKGTKRKKKTPRIMSVKETNNLILQERKAPQILDAYPLPTTGW